MFVNDCLREQQKKRRHLDRRPLAADHISLFLISSVKMNLSDVTSTERERESLGVLARGVFWNFSTSTSSYHIDQERMNVRGVGLFYRR